MKKSADTAPVSTRKKNDKDGLFLKYLMALMDSVPDYIYFKDRKSRFIRINKAHAEAFGLS